MTRAVNGAHSTLGVTAIAFDTPSIALLPGEHITDGTYHYPVESCTTLAITIGTAVDQTTAGLRAALADNATLTREDYYAPIDFETLCIMLGKEDAQDDGARVTIYHASRAARAYGEEIVGFIKARSQTKTFSMQKSSPYLFLDELNITSVTTLTIDDEEIDADNYTVNTSEGYILYDGNFPVGADHIDVVYVAGQAKVNPQLVGLYVQQTGLFLAQAMTGNNINVVSSSSASGSREFGFRNPSDVQAMLDAQWHRFAKVNC